MGAGYGLFTSVGEWVVNSGKWDKVQDRVSRECKMIKMINLHVLGGASWGRSPPPKVKVPQVIHS